MPNRRTVIASKPGLNFIALLTLFVSPFNNLTAAKAVARKVLIIFQKSLKPLAARILSTINQMYPKASKNLLRYIINTGIFDMTWIHGYIHEIMVSNHETMVMTLNSWVLPINSWLGFLEKVELWGWQPCQKLKNLCASLILKSEFQTFKPKLSY